MTSGKPSIFWAEKQWHCAPSTCVSFIAVRSVAVLYWRTARNYLIRNPFEDASTSVQIFHSPFSASLISVQFTVNGRMIENNFDVHEIGFARNCWLIKPSHPWAWKSHLGQKHSWDNLRSILFAKKTSQYKVMTKIDQKNEFYLYLGVQAYFPLNCCFEGTNTNSYIFGRISFYGGGGRVSLILKERKLGHVATKRKREDPVTHAFNLHVLQQLVRVLHFTSEYLAWSKKEQYAFPYLTILWYGCCLLKCSVVKTFCFIVCTYIKYITRILSITYLRKKKIIQYKIKPSRFGAGSLIELTKIW